jgi:carbon storage regulator
MLVLSRHRSQSVVIRTPSGEVIFVQVVDIRGDKIRLGFDAHQDVSVHRYEVDVVVEREKIERATRSAAVASLALPPMGDAGPVADGRGPR